MKIVGLFILFISLASPVFGSEIIIGRFKCNSNTYARIDNGDIDIYNIENTYVNRDQAEYYRDSENPLPNIMLRKKSNKITYIFAYDENEKFLFKRRISNNVLESHDLGLNKKTLFRFKDQSVVGINLVCRM